MTIFPDARLLQAFAAWSAAAFAAVLWPALLVPLGAACLVLIGLVGWDAFLLRRAPALVLERRIPERAFVDHEAEIEIEVSNPGGAQVRLQVVDELPPDLLPTDPAFDDVIVEPGEMQTLRYRVRPSRRGDRPLGGVVALERSPLGWLRRRSIGKPDQLAVYPDTSRLLSHTPLDPRDIPAHLGIKRALKRGPGSEFDSLREYVVGDDPRRIDWAATARRGRLITRLFRHERNHTVILAIDASRLMGARAAGRTKLDHAVDAALALSLTALSFGDRVGLAVFDGEVRGYLAPRAHRREFGAFVEMLRTVEPRTVEANYEALVRDLSLRQRQRALVVVLTDFVETVSARLSTPLAVLAKRHRVLLVALREHLYDALQPERAVESRETLDLYRRLVLDELLRDRETALARLRRQSVQTLDLVPEQITAPLINRYLELRFGPDR